MLRCYEPAHIVGISKTTYVLATPRCLEWRRDLQRTSTNNDPSDPDSQDPCRRPAGRHRGDRRSPRLPVAGVLVLDGRITHRRPRIAPSGVLAASTVVRLARLTVPSPTARRSSMTRFRVSPTSIQLSSVPCARLQPMPRTTGSSSSSTAAGVPRSTRNNYSVRRSRSTAQKRKLPDGWPPPTRLLTCRGTRSTSGPPMPRRGCPSTAPSTGCARSTATNPGTTNCAPKPSITVALPMYADPTHDPRMQQ